jgi:hypothetical protein
VAKQEVLEMGDQQSFYRFLAIQEKWSLREAINVIVDYIKSDWTGTDDATLYQEGKKLRSRYRVKLSNDIEVFANNVEYVPRSVESHLSGNGWDEVYPTIDEDGTEINVKRFIRWACSENIPLPKELKSHLFGNNTSTAADKNYLAISTKEELGEVIGTKDGARPNDELLHGDQKCNKAILNTEKARDVSLTVADLDETKVHLYRFEKHGQSWNIQFEDVVLRGVKPSIGFDYIKILLQNPNQKLSVLKLQQIAGSLGDEGDDDSLYGEYNDSYYNEEMMDFDPGVGEHGRGRANAWDVDHIAIASYKKRIVEIDLELQASRNAKILNRSKIQRLNDERDAIENQLSGFSSMSKDPDLEKNRKKITKNISEAIAKIAKLEESQEYFHKPNIWTFEKAYTER